MELWHLIRVLNNINILDKSVSGIKNLIFLLSLYIYIHKLKNSFGTKYMLEEIVQ